MLKIYQDLLLKNGLKSIRVNYNVNKEIRIKTSMLKSDLRDFNDAYIVVKGYITLEVIMMLINKIKILYLKIMHHLSIACQKLMA